MKIVVIGGSGLIGSKLVTKLRGRGHETLAASPASGVNALTGQGLAAALEGASVVTDVSNSPSFEDAAVLKFFQTSTRNLLAAGSAAGVGHHLALSVVGAERLPDSGYLGAKIAQEKLIEDSPIPYSIVHATQFFEFVGRIADEATSGNTVRLAHVLIQPMAADDVASALGQHRLVGCLHSGPADRNRCVEHVSAEGLRRLSQIDCLARNSGRDDHIVGKPFHLLHRVVRRNGRDRGTMRHRGIDSARDQP